MSIPENFMLLHQGEEHIRRQSLSFTETDQALLLHFDVLERSMNLIEYFSRAWETQDEDDITLQLLGVRLFNSSAASINLLLSGYYQASASLGRDVLETSFLVDLLANDRQAVARWRSAPEDERKKHFGPIHVRMALDARDGHTSRARAGHYALLSKLASHPTPEGFRLLRPGSGQPAKIGPFFNAETLGAVLSELAKIVIPAAGHFRRHFDPRAHVLPDFEVLFHFVEGAARWFERFFGRPVNKNEIEDARASLQMAQELARQEAARKAPDAPPDRDEESSSARPVDSPEKDNEESLFDPAWSRPGNSYGTFRRGKETVAVDKQFEERGFAEDALSGGGFTFAELRPSEVDPPDCTAIVDGKSTGIEVVELVDSTTLVRARQALKLSPSDLLQRLRLEVYREWTREDFLSQVRALITKKNLGNWKGGPYQRHMLVIHTDEMRLGPDQVKRFLDGEQFEFGFFSDVVVVLSYHPHSQAHPTFRLVAKSSE